MPDNTARILRVAAARADFIESGQARGTGVPDVVAASWRRSKAAGVDLQHPQAEFSSEFDEDSLLVRCASPVMAQLSAETSSLPMVIALTNNQARLVRRIDGLPTVGRILDGVDFAPGFDYAESSMGTNGVGTVLESRQSVSVVGPEHFADHLQSFACAGAPIFDPVTGRIEGVLDISTLAQTWSPLMHTLVKSAAKDISRNLLLDRSQSQQALFDTYVRTDARTQNQAVFAFGESVYIANAAAHRMFSDADQRMVREFASHLMSRRDEARDVIDLPDGRRIQLRGVRIVAGTQVAGMVVVADQLTAAQRTTDQIVEQFLPNMATASKHTARIADDLRKPQRSITTGTSPVWSRSCAQLRNALSDKRPTLVMGETGSGKFTMIAEIFHSLNPDARSLVIDAAQISMTDPAMALDALLSAAHEPTLHIVRNLDQATTDGVQRLDALLKIITQHGGVHQIAATLSDSSLDSDLPFRSLLPQFEVAVSVPSLRMRSDDLPGIITSLLSSIAPERRTALSPGALRVLRRYSWPRNISQLQDALTYALRQRPVGEIQENDLPPYCLTTASRELTVLEATERDTIIAALTEHGGNRVAAAAYLGMSRSSLYRKIKTYGIVA